MSTCGSCGEPIGHAQSIEGEYEQFEDRDKRYKYFGSTECKDIYEDNKGIVEKIECDECGELVEKSESVKRPAVVSGINVEERVHPTCRENAPEVSKTTPGENQE